MYNYFEYDLKRIPYSISKINLFFYWMQRRNIEFTEDAIRQKIELSPIEKYIKFGNRLSNFSSKLR